VHPFTRHFSESVSAWGEEKVLAAIRRWLGPVAPRTPFGMGHDCAVLPATPGQQLITVDPVIYRRHFDDTVPPRAGGAKLLKRNLSDLAAIGGKPTVAVLAVSLDPRVSRKWLEQFYRGLAACARQYGVSIVGGDLAQADRTVAASLTLLGRPAGRCIVTRTGARPGDRIFVTGVLGGSVRSGHHFRFVPRLAEGAWLARQAGVRSMMDVSDGIAKDLRALTPRGTVAALDPAALPRRAGCSLASALGDGEDFELVFTLARRTDEAAFVRQWRRRFPRTRLTHIGRFVRGSRTPAGSVNPTNYRGYEHLR